MWERPRNGVSQGPSAPATLRRDVVAWREHQHPGGRGGVMSVQRRVRIVCAAIERVELWKYFRRMAYGV